MPRRKQKVEFLPANEMTPPHYGEGWFIGSRLSTVIQKDARFKSLAGCSGKPEIAAEMLDLWNAQGWKGTPTGPHSTWNHIGPRKQSKIPKGTNRLLQSWFHGGWIETLDPSIEIIDPVTYYDIRNAYLWAGICQGFPTRYAPIRAGAPEPGARWVAVVDCAGWEGPEPPHYFRQPQFICCYQDVEKYRLQGVSIVYGVQWALDWEMSLGPYFERLDALLTPQALKILSRAYWGRYAATRPVIRRKYEGGNIVKTTEYKPTDTNIVWSVLIVHAVIRRCWEWADGAVLVATDALLTPETIPTGPEIGAWHEKSAGPGVVVNAAGVWSYLDADGKYPRDRRHWTKHAGYSTSALAGLPGVSPEQMLATPGEHLIPNEVNVELIY